MNVDGSIVQNEIPNSKCKEDGSVAVDAPIATGASYDGSAYGQAASMAQTALQLNADFKAKRELEKKHQGGPQ